MKSEHPAALALLGYGARRFRFGSASVDRTSIALSETMRLTAAVRSLSSEEQTLMMNYVIHFKKANGKNKPKVFRMPQISLAPNESRIIEKSHRFLPFKNQRFYSGTHYFELRANGVLSLRLEFELTTRV